jgi:hypothetical protein
MSCCNLQEEEEKEDILPELRKNGKRQPADNCST